MIMHNDYKFLLFPMIYSGNNISFLILCVHTQTESVASLCCMLMVAWRGPFLCHNILSLTHTQQNRQPINDIR